jgi:di/tricarboxylate transporter
MSREPTLHWIVQGKSKAHPNAWILILLVRLQCLILTPTLSTAAPPSVGAAVLVSAAATGDPPAYPHHVWSLLTVVCNCVLIYSHELNTHA